MDPLEGCVFNIIPFFNPDAPELSDLLGRPGQSHQTGCPCCSEKIHPHLKDQEGQMLVDKLGDAPSSSSCLIQKLKFEIQR